MHRDEINFFSRFDTGTYFKSETEMSIVSPLSIIILLVAQSNFVKDLPTPQPTYITKYDYLDIDKILENERILRRLMDCIMDRGPCTRAGKELKRKYA